MPLIVAGTAVKRSVEKDLAVCFVFFVYGCCCLSLDFSNERDIFPLYATCANTGKTGRLILLLLRKQWCLFSVVMAELHLQAEQYSTV